MNRKLLSIIASLGLLLPCYGLVTEHTNSVNLTLANVCDGSFNDFNFKISGYDSQKFKFGYNVSLAGVDCVFRITKPIQGTIYLDVPVTDITVSTTNVTWTISRTNIPPPGNYYGELLSYDAGTTNIYRSLAQGKLPVTWSLYLNETNYFQRSTTNAQVGQVYIHPTWQTPPWTVSSNFAPLASYQATSNALDVAEATITNHTSQIGAISNDLDIVEALAAGLNSRSSTWDTVTSKANDSALISVSNNVDVMLTGKVDYVNATYTATVGKASTALQYEYDTNALAQLAIETNRAIEAEANLYPASNPSNYISSYSEIETAFTNWLDTNTYVKVETDSIATNLIYVTSNAYGAADAVVRSELTNLNTIVSNAYVVADTAVRSELTNTITVASNHFENAKLNTDGSGAALTDVWHPSDSVTNAVDEQARADIILTSNAIPTTAAQVGAVPLSGGIMTGPLTNNVLIAGNGAGLTNVTEVYQGTLTGATIAAGSADAVTVTGPNAAITWNTNAAGGGGTSGDTNAVWGNITGTLADQLDLTSTVAKATSALQPAGNGALLTGVNATNATALGGIAAASYARKDIVETFLDGILIQTNIAIGSVGQPTEIGAINAGQSDFNVDMTATGVGSENAGKVTGINPSEQTMQASGYGSMNRGYVQGNTSRMYAGGIGSINLGHLLGHTVTNGGNGSVALCDDSGNITITHGASIVLGNGASLEDRSIKCDVVRATTLYGNGANITGITGITNPVGANVNFNAKDATNIGVIGGASLQVTGGATNGAVWLCTNPTTGEGKWSWPIIFQSYISANFIFTNATARTVTWDTAVTNINANWNGTTFTTSVAGIYRFFISSFFANTSGGVPTIGLWNINDSGTILFYHSDIPNSADKNKRTSFTFDVILTNSAPITIGFTTYGVISGTNYLAGGAVNNTIIGQLIRELP